MRPCLRMSSNSLDVKGFVAPEEAVERGGAGRPATGMPRSSSMSVSLSDETRSVSSETLPGWLWLVSML